MSEPYYNEAGYEKQKGTQQGQENSRMYNEMAILKMVQVSKPRQLISSVTILMTLGILHLCNHKGLLLWVKIQIPTK